MYLTPRAYDNFDKSVLQEAVLQDDMQKCQQVWKNTDDEEQVIAFHLALRLKHANVLPVMLDTIDHYHIQTGLSTASEEGGLECVKLLINAGADPAAEGGEALWLSCQGGHKHVLNHLLPLTDPKDYPYALYVAASHGEMECVRALFPLVSSDDWSHLINGFMEANSGDPQLTSAITVVRALVDHQSLTQTLGQPKAKTTSKKKI